MERGIHLHSMVVHAVLAFVVVATLALALDGAGAVVAGFVPGTWALLWHAALVLALLAALPATVSGIFERNHMYANWPASHRAKLVLSLALVGLLVAELAATIALGGGTPRVGSALGLAVVVANPLVALALSFYGLRITLGRQAAARTSYMPEMFRTPPVDVLEGAAAFVAERAKVIEVMEEGG